MITVKTKESARAIESFFLVFFCQSGERKNARQLQRSVKAATEAPSEEAVVQRRIECPSGTIVSASLCKRTV